jgi:tetratricopeptide (TPR) repeat protein
MIRQFLLFFCAAAALVAAPVPVHAEVDVGFEFYEKQAKEILKAAGVKIWGAADDARKNGLFQWAAEQAERSLEFDPNLEEARKYLGFVKKDGKWVDDPEVSSKVPKQNVQPQNRGADSQAQLEKKWKEGSLQAADKFCAKLYADLGDACAAKGYAKQAEKGYESSMRLDKDNERARKGLGYTKFGKVWLTKKQDEARKAASKAEVVTEADKDTWEELLGEKLNKVQSQHYRFESPYDVAELQLYAQTIETAYAYYLADFGKDPGEDVFEGKRMLFLVLKTDAEWNKVVDRFVTGDKEWVRTMGGTSLDQFTEVCRSNQGSTVDTRKDFCVHTGIHTMNHRIWKLSEHAWLDEGLAYYYSIKVMETCLTHCVAKKNGDYANGHKDIGGDKEWGSADGWKPMMKTLVQKKDDTALRTISMQPIAKLDFLDTVKAWSIASWLMDQDRDKFTSILDQMLDPAVKQENVIQGTYGMGYEAIDDEWHKYVLKCY